MGGSIFSAGSLLGDGPISGQDSSLYTTDVFNSSGNDASQYTDSGQDPTQGNGGNFLSTLGTVVNDAFKAYSISQTPTSYRSAAPNSPAAIQASSAAATAKTTNTLIMFGGLIVIVVVLYVLFKK